MANMPESYAELEARLIGKIDTYQGNAVVENLISYKLPNKSPPTDFDDWAECMSQSVERNFAAIKEWGQMK
jgi:truncated hemoglobin YjbI